MQGEQQAQLKVNAEVSKVIKTAKSTIEESSKEIESHAKTIEQQTMKLG